jgi:ligand-binding sensor protein
VPRHSGDGIATAVRVSHSRCVRRCAASHKVAGSSPEEASRSFQPHHGPAVRVSHSRCVRRCAASHKVAGSSPEEASRSSQPHHGPAVYSASNKHEL